MSAPVPLRLEEIYLPIEEELSRLDGFLQQEFSCSEPFIYELLCHVSKFRGKQIRPALLLLTSRYYGPVGDDPVKIAGVIELIHTATLVHDDILDGADLRRRVATIHRRWGERAAVLLGDFIYSRAFTLSTEVPGMARVLADTTHTICEGELLEIGNLHRPDLEEEVYLEIISKKTAVLHAASCYLGARLGGAPEEEARQLYRYGRELGMGFQVIDDCLDFAGEEGVMGKTLGTDLEKGKMTLPLIYLRECLPAAEARWVEEVMSRPATSGELGAVREKVILTGACDMACRRAEAFTDRAKSFLAGVGHAELRERLEQMADYVLLRKL